MDSKRGYSETRPSSSSPAASPAPGGGKAAGGNAYANGGNAYANDGSFMEMFKKTMEAEKRQKEMEQQGCSDTTGAEEGQSTQEKKSLGVTSFVGKRRGSAKLALKTGMVAKKQKLDPEIEPGKGEAWQHYMAEVKKYKAQQCGDDDKTRPLVK